MVALPLPVVLILPSVAENNPEISEPTSYKQRILMAQASEESSCIACDRSISNAYRYCNYCGARNASYNPSQKPPAPNWRFYNPPKRPSHASIKSEQEPLGTEWTRKRTHIFETIKPATSPMTLAGAFPLIVLAFFVFAPLTIKRLVVF